MAIFDHMDPHRSSLSLCENADLTFDELRRLSQPRVGRRLLVLDACDSGAAPMYGGLSDFGFGPQLSSEVQAVISHRWPVEQFPSAIFNLLLAVGLRSKSFYHSYESAISTMIGGREAIAAVLGALLGRDHDVVGRIRDNESIRWHTIAVWGSAAFFE
jgi:hypothetical protein